MNISNRIIDSTLEFFDTACSKENAQVEQWLSVITNQ